MKPHPRHAHPIPWLLPTLLLPAWGFAAEGTSPASNHAPSFTQQEGFELPPVEPRPGASPGSSVMELLGNSVADPDKNAQRGLAVTAADNSHGRWQFSLDNGDSWTDFSPLSESSATLLPASPTARIRFDPEKGYEGKAEIQFRAWDQTHGKAGESGVDVSRNGGNTPFSDNQEKANIDIKPLQQFDKSELASTLLNLKSPDPVEVDRVLLELMRRGISVNESSALLEAARKKSPCAQ